MHQQAPVFDALHGGEQPTPMFGSVLCRSASLETLQELSQVAATARSSVHDILHRDVQAGEEGMLQLDAIVKKMWEDGWDPAEGNLALFVTHFGSLLATALLSLSGSEAVFRDERALDHASVFLHLEPPIEYFPFHKAYKCLTNRDGDSFAQLFRDASRRAGV